MCIFICLHILGGLETEPVSRHDGNQLHLGFVREEVLVWFQ